MRRLLLSVVLLFSITCSSPAQSLQLLTPKADGPVPALWGSVVSCLGDLRDTAQTLQRVTWMLRSPVLINGDTLIGQWSGDTIFLTEGHENDDWVIKHELVHHALSGPPMKTNPHPLMPFLACGVYVRPEHDNAVPLIMRKLRTQGGDS